MISFCVFFVSFFLSKQRSSQPSSSHPQTPNSWGPDSPPLWPTGDLCAGHSGQSERRRDSFEWPPAPNEDQTWTRTNGHVKICKKKSMTGRLFREQSKMMLLFQYIDLFPRIPASKMDEHFCDHRIISQDHTGIVSSEPIDPQAAEKKKKKTPTNINWRDMLASN